MYARAVLVLLILSQTGCVQSVLGVLLAPEAVVGGAVGSVAEAGAETLSGMSLDAIADQENTLREIDNLIKNNPDAVNVDRLRALQEQIRGTPAHTGPDQRQFAQEGPAPRRPMDKGLPVRKGDALFVEAHKDTLERRPDFRPVGPPTGTSLQPEHEPIHIMSLDSVRLR